MGRCGVAASGLEYGPIVGFCENGSNSSGSIPGGEFVDELSGYQFFKKGCVPRSQYVFCFLCANRTKYSYYHCLVFCIMKKNVFTAVNYIIR